MKYDMILNLIFIFILYSFLGWLLEAIVVYIKEKRFVNRGISNGPFCTLYGIAAIIITLVTNINSNIFGVFLASVIYSSLLEIIAGKLLERFNKKKWWDYSNKKYNFDGYICLRYSLIWGLLGVIIIKFINPLIFNLSLIFNSYIFNIIVLSIFLIIIIDTLFSFSTLKNINKKKLSISNISSSIMSRLENAYPNIKNNKKIKKESKEVFAPGLSFYKIFSIFIIFALLGDIIEVFYCRYSMGRWMSRSSFVYGPFSIVWGLAFVLATIILSRYQKKSNTYLFIFGTILGGAFEYACSVFTEYFFGTIFWDYSKIPFNINGRINLLFCFFWGFAVVLFVKKLYPFLSKLIEKIPKKVGIIFANLLFIFIIFDILLTASVMWRYKMNVDGIPSNNKIERFLDHYANDKYMKSRWPNMKLR